MSVDHIVMPETASLKKERDIAQVRMYSAS